MCGIIFVGMRFMGNMEFERLIELADIKEAQAFAFTCAYSEKMDRDELQKAIDCYCDNMARRFVLAHQAEIGEREININLRRHISMLGADKKHSGKRFYEALFMRLNHKEEAQEI